MVVDTGKLKINEACVATSMLSLASIMIETKLEKCMLGRVEELEILFIMAFELV